VGSGVEEVAVSAIDEEAVVEAAVDDVGVEVEDEEVLEASMDDLDDIDALPLT
jgi:hypothetical protein